MDKKPRKRGKKRKIKKAVREKRKKKTKLAVVELISQAPQFTLTTRPRVPRKIKSHS